LNSLFVPYNLKTKIFSMRNQFRILSAMVIVLFMVVAVSCKKDDDSGNTSVEKVILSTNSKALKVGASFILTDSIVPSTASNKDVTWSSTNSAVAVVSSKGEVVGIAEGTAKIVVTTDDGGLSDTCVVTVATNIVAVESVFLNVTSVTKTVGDTVTLKATINPIDATVQTVAWTSSDITIATVSSTGIVTALKAGTATITASADGKTATCVVTVNSASNVVTVSGEVKGTRTFVSDSVYLLQGFVYVVDGAVLTIQPGTVIKGQKSSMGTLIVERGGKVMAEGTSAKPIVFTSEMDPGARTYSDWGGVVLCGKATINTTSTDPGVGLAQVEGGPRTIYGGGTTPNDADNSGVLKYVRIEFAGYPFQPDKEINGLTLCGVGSGTTIDYIQVSYSGDDSYEWFGGTVNVKHIIAFRGQDDEFDTDFGYSGKVQFALGLRDFRKADISGSNGFESDNDASGSSNTPKTSCVFSNVTLIGPYDSTTAANVDANFKRGMHIRRNSALSCFNSVFAGWNTGLFIDGSASLANMTNGELVIKNCFLVGMKTSNFEGSDTSTVATWFRNTMTGNRTFAPAVLGANPNRMLGLHKMFPTNKTTFVPDFSALSSEITTGASFTDSKLSSGFTTVSYIGAISPSDNWTSGWANWNPQSTVY
jgi:hypothetical protein